ncbi:MAG TPA: fibronectin type III domain-containing protein [Steroidobacteraceae bacterium]
MTQFALAARNLFLCARVTLPLAACGGGSDGSSSAAATSADTDTATALVSPSVGVIDRSSGADSTASVASVASNTTSTAPNTAATTPASGTNTSSNSSGATTSTGTVAKTATPVTTVNGVATLDWLPPTENSDGSALTNLAGYTVYYGTSPDNLAQSVKVSNPGLTAYAVTGLSSGTWYFAVTAYSADGVESSRTTAVSTKI